MKWEPKQSNNRKFGDTRVVREFAYFPIRVTDFSNDLKKDFVIWWERYERVERYCHGLGWCFYSDALLGTGEARAVYVAKTWDGVYTGEAE